MYYVVEGMHTDPSDYTTMNLKTRKIHGPFENEQEANRIWKSVAMQSIDFHHHRAWIKHKKDIDNDSQ